MIELCLKRVNMMPTVDCRKICPVISPPGILSASSIKIIIFDSFFFTHRFLSTQQLCSTIFIVCGIALPIFL